MTTVTVDVDIDLSDFDTDDLIEELESRGYAVAKGESLSAIGDLDHVEHLAVCGQLDAARTEALRMVSNAIGRRLQ